MVSLLVRQVIGPLPRDMVPMVLDYHGLAGQPAGTLIAVATRHHVTPPTVSTYVRHASRPDEDPLQHSCVRRRITGLLRARTNVRI